MDKILRTVHSGLEIGVSFMIVGSNPSRASWYRAFYLAATLYPVVNGKLFRLSVWYKMVLILLEVRVNAN